MSAEIIFALACATAAIVYGIVSVKWILAKPSGNERMQEIAGAIQEGAKAYLNRQYMTIGMAGIVLFLVIGFSGIGWSTGRPCWSDCRAPRSRTSSGAGLPP